MKKLLAVLAAAAAIAGGVSLSDALRQAGQEAGMTCADWSQIVAEAQGEELKEFFVAVQDGYVPPDRANGRILGNRAPACPSSACETLNQQTCEAEQVCGWVAPVLDDQGGEVYPGRCEQTQICGPYLVAKPTNCGPAVTYEYQRSGAVNGWRVFRLRGPKYFAKSWRLLGEAQSEVHFMRSWKELVQDCLAHLTAPQCRQLLDSANGCWQRAGGFYCRQGLLYGPGLGGVNQDGSPATCTVQVGDVPYPCLGDSADYGERVMTTDYAEEAD